MFILSDRMELVVKRGKEVKFPAPLNLCLRVEFTACGEQCGISESTHMWHFSEPQIKHGPRLELGAKSLGAGNLML